MAERKSGIYCWTNKVNGKPYVGQAQDLYKRKCEFLSFGYTTYAGRRINCARKHYNSAEYWDYEVLEYCDIEALNERETYWVKERDSYENGYNLTLGGDGNRGYKISEETRRKLAEANRGRVHSAEARRKMSEAAKGRVCSEETKKKLSDLNKGKKLSEETCKKMSESQKGRKGPWSGKHQTEETKRKRSESLKGHSVSEDARRRIGEAQKRPISQYYMNGEFIKNWDCIQDAADAVGIKRGGISEVIRGKNKSAGGFKWTYAA